MSGAANLAERTAETLRQRATNDQMTWLRAGVVIPAYEEGVSKRDRARQGILAFAAVVGRFVFGLAGMGGPRCFDGCRRPGRFSQSSGACETPKL